MKNKNQLVILGVIVLAAIALRFSPILEQRDFWYDEAFTGIILKQDFATMNQYIFKDVHPPLYYWLVKPWAMLGSYSPFAIRSFSAMLGVLTVVSVFWIGKKMYSDRAGLLAALITTFSPFAILYSQEARMYALFGFLMVWTVWFFYQALESGEKKHWIAWGVLGGLSFYTHYLSLFFFMSFFVTFVCYNIIFNKKRIRGKGRFANCLKSINFFDKGFWLGTGIALLFFLSWVKFLIGHLSRKSLGWVPSADFSDIPETLQFFFYGHKPGEILEPVPNAFRSFDTNLTSNGFTIGPFFNESSLGLLILVLIIVAFSVLWLKNKNRKENLVLLILSIGTLLLLIFISWVGVKLYVARYFMPVAVLIYLLFSGSMVSLFKNRWTWIMTLFFFGLTLFWLKPIEYKTGWYQLIENGQLDSKGPVVIDNPFDYASGRYYLGDRARLYNRYDPTQDFSLWIIINPESVITKSEEIKTIPEVEIVDDENCDWDGIDLEQVGDYENLKLCEIK